MRSASEMLKLEIFSKVKLLGKVKEFAILTISSTPGSGPPDFVRRLDLGAGGFFSGRGQAVFSRTCPQGDEA